MKNLLTAFLPALALLALGGCASTSGLATSEDDGVYYSSKDHTTAVVRAAPAQETAAASTDEAANPDYNGNTANKPRAAAIPAPTSTTTTRTPTCRACRATAPALPTTCPTRLIPV
ncbi:hypothetical protein ACFQT0_07495 [Hymenobacter humi]|uniref:Uncharacterized protein n=1 Tax=Hymenobacter humi TaxID=1411620 RepID=A0ABW2U305_9BACT